MRAGSAHAQCRADGRGVARMRCSCAHGSLTGAGPVRRRDRTRYCANPRLLKCSSDASPLPLSAAGVPPLFRRQRPALFHLLRWGLGPAKYRAAGSRPNFRHEEAPPRVKTRRWSGRLCAMTVCGPREGKGRAIRHGRALSLSRSQVSLHSRARRGAVGAAEQETYSFKGLMGGGAAGPMWRRFHP